MGRLMLTGTQSGAFGGGEQCGTPWSPWSRLAAFGEYQLSPRLDFAGPLGFPSHHMCHST